jgi:hypothetical protein
MEKFATNAELVYQIVVDNIFNAKDPKTGRRRMTSIHCLRAILEAYPTSTGSICNGLSFSNASAASAALSSSPSPLSLTYAGSPSSESLLTAAFLPNKYKELKARANVCIVGAGPVGVYMAILLKHLMPSLTVNVIEKRATESGHRSLIRDKELYIPSAFISRTRVFPTWPDPGPDVAVIEEALTRLCPSLASLLRVEGGFHLLGFLPSYAPTRRDIRINRLELELAKVAQKKGVRIYHDNGITDLASIESRYTNEYTLVVFDATGGRLIPVEFPKINTYTPPAVVPDKKLNTEHRTERVVPIYEGHLDPRSALRVLVSSLYAPIGDTFMKVDFRAASPGTVNGMILCVGMALAFMDAFSPKLSSKSSSKRKTSKRSSSVKRRKTRSAPF